MTLRCGGFKRHRGLLAAAAALAALGCQGPAGPGATDDVDAAEEEQTPDAAVTADRPRDSGAAVKADAAAAADTRAEAVTADANSPDVAPADPEDAAAAPDAGAPGDPGRVGAAGVEMGLVEVAQAVFIKVGDGATVVPPAERNSTLIEARAAYLRAYVRTADGFKARPLTAVLTLSYAQGAPLELEDRKTISAASAAETLNSTFNFLLPAEAMKPETKLAIAVYEGAAATGEPPPAPPRFPATGATDLAIAKGPMSMEVVLVQARGPSGPLDDSPARRKRLEAYLADVYPVQKMTIRWREPLPITKVINASTAFQMLQAARKSDGAAAGAYYHMLIAAEDCSDKYLGLGATAGFRAADAPNRIAMTMVTEHQVDSQMDTVSHEMGHNLGRDHAPGCNAGGVDPKFPYANTGVGVNGFSLGELAAGRPHLPNAPGPWKNKARFKDVMGYCYPTWISDYTWNAFAVRIRLVTALAPPAPTPMMPPMPMLLAPAPPRTLQGFYAPGRPPAWVVVDGTLVPEDARATEQRWARLTRADGSTRVVPVTMNLLRSPAGPEHAARMLAVDLPDEAIISVEVTVDGERFTASATDVDGL